VTTAKIVDDAVTGAKLADDIAITTTGNVSVNGGSFTFNESGASVDLRAETDGQTHALFIDGSADAIGLFNSAPSFTSGPGMHLADDVKIGFGTGGSSRPDFQLSADSSNLKLACGFGADTADINIATSAVISTGQETAPDAGSGGITLNAGATDAYILTFKNTDIAQDTTGIAEADTFAAFEQANDTNGGLGIRGFAAAGTTAIDMIAYFETNNTSKATNANVPVRVVGRLNSSTSFTAPSNGDASANLFGVSDSNTLRFIVDSEGDLHRDNLGDTAYDTYDDAQLMRALDLTRGKQLKGFINSKFDEYVKYNHEDLAQAGLVGREDDGTPNNFINITGFQRLHHGAIWQQYEKHQRLAEAVYEMAKEALGEDKADAILEKHDIKLLN
jgi:hypothetical protein